MLHRTMAQLSRELRLGLEDLLAEFRHARRKDDLGRLAAIAYCNVRRWAMLAGRAGLAERAGEIVTAIPHPSRESFLAKIDHLIDEVQRALPQDGIRHPNPHG